METTLTLLSRITVDPAFHHGKPCIRGKDYLVRSMVDLLKSGMTIDQLLDDYPDLEREDILACLEFDALSWT